MKQSVSHKMAKEQIECYNKEQSRGEDGLKHKILRFGFEPGFKRQGCN